MEQGEQWFLCVGDINLGRLIYSSYETPWTTCTFLPDAAFARWKPYFTDDSQWDDADLVLEALCAEVSERGGVTLVHAKTGEVTFPLIQFSDDYTYAWFRHSAA